MMIFRTHYDNLKVSREAPMVVINAAYKALCQVYHPDKFQGHKDEAERIFKIIVQSYGVLSDPVKKAEHDQWIEQQLTEQKQGFALVSSICEDIRPSKHHSTDTANEKTQTSSKNSDAHEKTNQHERHNDSEFVVGHQGPAGGIVFFVDSSGLHGLEAQTADLEGTFTWQEALTTVSNFGQGWHLPTKPELDLLYQKKNTVGGFSNSNYWSSTKSVDTNAWTQYFSNGYQYDYNINLKLLVRAVRGF